MDQTPAPDPDRPAGGFLSVQNVFLALLVFGVYTGCKFIPASCTQGQIERAVESVLSDVPHDANDDGIRKRIVRKLNVASIPLEPEAITVRRGKRYGQRILHVDIDYPVTVRYLGAERTLDWDVHVTTVKRVDEKVEARLAKARRRQEEELRQRQEEIQANRDRELDEALEDCEREHGMGNCEVFSFPGGDPNEVMKLY